MIIEVLGADAITMSVCIVSPAVDARISNISRQKSPKPVDVVCRSPSLFTVSIQPMDGNNAGNSQCQLLTICMDLLVRQVRDLGLVPQDTADDMHGLLYNWLISLCDKFKTLAWCLRTLLTIWMAYSTTG